MSLPPVGTTARPRLRPRVLWSGSADQATRLPETVVAFAGAGRASTETVVAFAGAKRVFLVHFSGAEVMPVSEVPCWGRAVVMVVSQLPRGCVLCAKKFALLGLIVGASAKKFALRTKNGPKLAFCGALGEFSRENTAGGVALGEVFRG